MGGVSRVTMSAVLIALFISVPMTSKGEVIELAS
jgi:hypothetical protein